MLVRALVQTERGLNESPGVLAQAKPVQFTGGDALVDVSVSDAVQAARASGRGS